MTGSQTKGTVASCACPWCLKPNDFRDVEDIGVEAGNTFTCDHCKKIFMIAKVQPVKMIWLKRT